VNPLVNSWNNWTPESISFVRKSKSTLFHDLSKTRKQKPPAKKLIFLFISFRSQAKLDQQVTQTATIETLSHAVYTSLLSSPSSSVHHTSGSFKSHSGGGGGSSRKGKEKDIIDPLSSDHQMEIDEHDTVSVVLSLYFLWFYSVLSSLEPSSLSCPLFYFLYQYLEITLFSKTRI
jgi:hypothetical protein